MDGPADPLEEEVLRLYREPVIGAGYGNTYGEANIQNLVKKYRDLGEADMRRMTEMLTAFSRSGDLASSYVSVGALHALGKKDAVAAAYEWAKSQDDPAMFAHHFDIGKSIADHFAGH
ncbi:MAG: hypothetical protein HZA02_03535 [Nitrospinae bacterium]|nr:hypothetical protein [Nitrospinota bacterium]